MDDNVTSTFQDNLSWQLCVDVEQHGGELVLVLQANGFILQFFHVIQQSYASLDQSPNTWKEDAVKGDTYEWQLIMIVGGSHRQWSCSP